MQASNRELCVRFTTIMAIFRKISLCRRSYFGAADTEVAIAASNGGACSPYRQNIVCTNRIGSNGWTAHSSPALQSPSVEPRAQGPAQPVACKAPTDRGCGAGVSCGGRGLWPLLLNDGPLPGVYR